MAAGHSTPINPCLASGCVFDPRMILMISSIFGQRQQQPFDRVLPRAGPAEQELRASADDRRAVPDELEQHVLDRHDARLAVDQRQQNDRDRVLQRRKLVQLVEDHVRIGVALQFDHQPHRLLQVALVADTADAGDAAIVDQGGDFFLDPVPLLHVGDF